MHTVYSFAIAMHCQTRCCPKVSYLERCKLGHYECVHKLGISLESSTSRQSRKSCSLCFSALHAFILHGLRSNSSIIPQNEQVFRTPCSHWCTSPNFLHFVGLDRGRHPGLPSGVAKVTRPSIWTESLSHVAKTLGIARLPEIYCGQAITTWVLS
jgi:hypothetical protein